MDVYTLPAALHFCAKARVFPLGPDPLHSSLRKEGEKEEGGTVSYTDRGNGPHRQRQADEKMKRRWSVGNWDVQDGAFLSEAKGSQRINISPDLSPAPLTGGIS